jgi:hypothetical protein
MSERIFRVTVRGQFRNLSDQARRYLEREQAAHDIFVSAYTREGTLTYDARISFFNLRYEVRLDDTSDANAADIGREEAEIFLRTMGFDHSDLKVTVADVSATWSDVQ